MPHQDIAFITGANKGLGLETARQLAYKGYRVLLGSRNQTLGQEAVALLEAEGLRDVETITIDVTDPQTIANAANIVEERYGSLDVLVNNAGVCSEVNTDPTHLDLDLARTDFEANFFGVLAVTNAFIPLLRKAPSGVPRIVNVSSTLGSHNSHDDPSCRVYGLLRYAAYGSSKAALNLYTQNLAFALKDAGFKVNVVSPGSVRTDMGGPDAPLSVSEGAIAAVFLSTIGADGPTGEFYIRTERHPW